MQSNSENKKTSTSENVISLFAAKAAQSEKASAPKSEEFTSFEDEVKRNKEIAERLRKERQKANQAVIRSYRLKS